MLKKITPRILLMGLVPVALLSCKGKGEDSAQPAADEGCTKPTAHAGDSTTLPLGSQVTVDGGGSAWCEDHAADAITFTWIFESTPKDSSIDEFSLSDNRNSTAVSADFIPDVPGEYVISLRVNDPDNASEPSFVIATISSDDLPPSADCGEDLLGRAGTASTLDGSSSNDPEGAELTYLWNVAAVPDCSKLHAESLFDRSSPSPTIIPDCGGLFVVSLVVTDGLQDSAPVFCTVDATSDNQPPIASAGTNEIVSSCADNPFQLNGWASFDEEGNALTYKWSLQTAPEGADPTAYGFDDDTLVNPLFTWDVPGDWTFLLQVNDGETWSAPDSVTHTINGDDKNNAPSAVAGSDISISTTAPCSSGGSSGWECGPCEITTAELDGSGSHDPDIDILHFLWTETDGTLSFSSTQTAISTVTFPSVEPGYGETVSSSHEVTLAVEDCSLSDNDHITITYQCTGVYDYGW
jgi:hypothetical protein